MHRYSRAAFGAKWVSSWSRGMGWDAEPLTGPMSGKVTLIPPALFAGFGELGKHGSIINPAFGSSFLLSGVLTDCQMPLDAPDRLPYSCILKKCRICETACPPQALVLYKKWCEVKQNGMSVSINVCRFSMNIRDAPYPSQSAHGTSPAWG